MSRLLCISREPEGLVALLLPPEREAVRPARVPIEQLTGPEATAHAALKASWEHLGRARGATAETLAHVLRVLLLTVPGTPGPAPSRPHSWLMPPAPPHRRTAAHPRGYRGTLYQPPKRARPEVLDLRPHLLHRATARALLDVLRPHALEALERLGDEGLPRERLALVLRAMTTAPRADVGLAWRHGVVEERGAELPVSLSWLGCLLTPGEPRDLGRLRALRGRLALESHPEVLMEALRVLAQGPPDWGLGWLEAAAPLPPESQREWFVLLTWPKVPRVDASRYDPRIEAVMSQRPVWRGSYLFGLGAGLSNDYLLSGFRVMAAHGLDADWVLAWPLPTSSGPVPEACLLEVFASLGPLHPDRDWLPCLWALCGELPGFAELFASTPWKTLSLEAVERLVSLLADVWTDASAEDRPRWWKAIRLLHPRLLRLLERVPASHQQRCIHMVFHLLGDPGAKWRGPDWLEPTTFALAERLCKPPFSALNRLSFVLEPLVLHPEPGVRERLLRTSERSLLRVEAFCSRSALAGLMGEGMPVLVQHQTALVLDALDTCPDTLAHTAQLLGSLHAQLRPGVLEDFARHPFVRENPFQLPPARLVALLREHCTPGVDSPLPRKARLTWEAGGVLTPGQTERALREASGQLPRLRMQVLARFVLERLRGGVEADLGDTRVRHAFQMTNLIEDNRRGLRRLLGHYFAGRRDFVLQHPESRAWFARHPRVPAEVWLTGLDWRRELPGHGPVSLSVEQDVLEVLRMGTHVGSCFGLNDSQSHSAAAFALDVNKRVLYARDTRGTVLARQALAITRDDTLVAFPVYPPSSPPALEALFLDYDLAFARRLGLTLHEGAEDPRVEHVLSNSFWLDHPWELGPGT